MKRFTPIAFLLLFVPGAIAALPWEREQRLRDAAKDASIVSPLDPQQPTQGANVGRNTLRGPAQITTQFSMQKTFVFADGRSLNVSGPLTRTFGSMPRCLGHYVRDMHLLPLEQAIRKIACLPAQREHLTNHGLLKEGYFADVAIFDPKTILDKATYTEPAQLSQGVKYVFVNGQLEFENGKLTGVNAGKGLHRNGVP